MKTEQKLNARTFPYRGLHFFQLQKKDVEINNASSMTIQDDSYTVREIMEKFAIQGETWDQKNSQFQEEVTHDSLDLRQVMNMDLVDRDELLSEAKIKAHNAALQLAEIKKKIDAENALKVADKEEEEENKNKRAKEAKPTKSVKFNSPPPDDQDDE